MDLKISQLPSHSDLSNISAMVGVYNGQNVQISGADMLAGISGVSEVTASLPLSVAKGTTTPAISLSQATNTTDGYLSSVDWNTFNNKTSNTGTVTGVISNTASQLTVTNGSTNAELDIQTAVVAKGGTALATGDQIASYVSSEIAANVPSNIALVSTSTANYVPRWNATANTLENGTIQNVGTNVGIGTAPAVELHVKGASSILRLETTSTSNDNFVEFYDPSERKGWIGYPASTTSTDALFIRNEEHGAKIIISTTNAKGDSNTAISIDGDQKITFKGAYTFPTADGSSNQVLQTDGAGQLSFATIDLSNSTTGTLGVANGGTGQTTEQAAIDALTQVSGATTGDVLTKDASGNASWETPAAGSIDFSSLNISSIKADLTQASQTQYGEAITVKASSAIDNGAVVIWDYSGAEVQAKMPSGSTPDQHEIIGIAIEDIAAGSTGKVLIYGYATAKYDTVSGTVVSSLALNSGSTGGTTVVGDTTERTTFTDDGGTGSNYSNGVNYTHTFSNVGGGNISMKFISWSIEQSTSNLWDRLGFTVSNDGVTYQNAEFTPHTTSDNGGWRTSVTTTAPWSSSEGSAGPNNSGYILASDPGTNFPVNSVIDTGYPYVRAYFESDSSTSEAGWEIEVYGQNALSGAPVIGQGAYISINDLTEISRSSNTGRTLGTFVGTDITNDAVVMFVAPARPQIS